MFSVTLSSENRESLEQVERYGLSRGCLSGGVAHEVTLDLPVNGEDDEIQQPELMYSQRGDTFYEIYGIMRHGELGYVGITSAGAARRVSQHIKKAEAARDEFVQWLVAGLDLKDIQAGVIATCIGKAAAANEEKRLIRKLHPLFNILDGESGLVRKIGGLQQLQIDTGE